MKAISTLALLCLSLCGARAVTLHVDVIQQNWNLSIDIYGTDIGPAHLMADFTIGTFTSPASLGYLYHNLIAVDGFQAGSPIQFGVNTVSMVYQGITYGPIEFTLVQPTGPRPDIYELVGVPDGCSTGALAAIALWLLLHASVILKRRRPV